MKPFVFDSLSPDAVRNRLDVVDLEEKVRLAEGLAPIVLMDACGNYLEAGYSCMQKYRMGRLGMSEDRARKNASPSRRAGERHGRRVRATGARRSDELIACRRARSVTLRPARA